MVTQPEFIDFEKNYNNVKPTPFEEFGNLWMLDQRCRVNLYSIKNLTRRKALLFSVLAGPESV